MYWKPILEWTDLPEYAGMEVDLTVENRFGQIFVTTAFQGYGDFKWHTNNIAFMEAWKSGDNRLSHNWKPLAWRHRPEPYNPYLIDARYLIEQLNALVKTDRSTIEIKKKLIPLVEDHLIHDEAPRHFYKQWREKGEEFLEEESRMLTKEQQTILLHDAARLSSMDGHVQVGGCTAAEKVMQMFGGKRNTPRKMSYLYCDAVDACFYFCDDKACCTFTARWFDGSKDLDRLADAGTLIKTMLHNMQALADEAVTEEQEGSRNEQCH